MDEDLQLTSTGKLRLPEGLPVEPGERVLVEGFRLTCSPKLARLLGVEDWMDDEQANEVLMQAFLRVAEDLPDEPT